MDRPFAGRPALRRALRFKDDERSLLHFGNSLSARTRYVAAGKGSCMFEIYLNGKLDRLLVIKKGQPIPVIENSGRWRKKKGAVAVSDEIKLALLRRLLLAQAGRTANEQLAAAEASFVGCRQQSTLSRSNIGNFPGSAE
jgi:hypothetical protein